MQPVKEACRYGVACIAAYWQQLNADKSPQVVIPIHGGFFVLVQGLSLCYPVLLVGINQIPMISMNISIKTKILIFMLIIAFIPGLVGVLFTYFKGSEVFKNSMGEKFSQLAQQTAFTLDTLAILRDDT